MKTAVLCYSLMATLISITANADSENISKYKFVYEELSWTEAKEKAEALGGQLACLETKAEMDYIESIRQNRKTVWLGLTDIKNEGDWVWINGEKLDNKMFGNLEKGFSLESRDYGHLMQQGKFLSRDENGSLPAAWQGEVTVQGYLIEWPSKQ